MSNYLETEMFKPAAALDAQITALSREIFGRDPDAQQLAQWLQDIAEQKRLIPIDKK